MSHSNLYTHTFTWPPTPSQSVIVTGTFDNWSGTRHHLHKDESAGGFWKGSVEIPFGERIAYKYVVDGHWLIREDEAKEWDAAGNMNNIFTAPAQKDVELNNTDKETTTSTISPTSSSSAAAGVVGAGVVGAGAVTAAATATATATATPRSPSKTETPIPGTENEKTEPVAAPAPSTSTYQREKAQEEHNHDHNHEHEHDGEKRGDGKDESVLDKAKDLISSHGSGSTSGVAVGSTTNATERQERDGQESSNIVSGSRGVAMGGELEAGKLVVGESTKAGNDLLGGLALGAPIGGGSPSYGGYHTTTTSYTAAPSSLNETAVAPVRDVDTNATSSSTVHTGPTTVSNNPEASSKVDSTSSTVHTGPTTVSNNRDATSTGTSSTHHEPSEPLKDLAVATSPILGSNAGVTNNAAHLAAKETSEKLSAHHDPADALKELAEATAPVFGSSAGSTTAHAHQEIKAIDQTPAQPLKELADATAPFGTSSVNSTAAADKVRESSTSGPNVPTSAQTAEHHEGLAETVSHFGTSALAALGAAATGLVSGANEAVHNATGLDLLHGNPMTVQEAKEKGIDTATGQPIETSSPSTTTATSSASPAAAGQSVPSASVIAAPAASAAAASANSTYAQWSKGPQGLGAGLGAPLSGSVTGPSPAAFAAPVSTGLAGGPGQAAPLGTASGPTPAQVGGVAPTTTYAAPAAVVVPVAVQPQSSTHHQHSEPSSTDKVASNTRQATSSRPAESNEVDVFSSNTPGSKDKDPKGNDILGQEETREKNHKKVPQPMITNIGQPTKDRTKPNPTEEAGTKMSSRPDADPKQAALNEERNKRNGAVEGVPSRSYAKPADANQPVAGLPLGVTQKPLASDVAPATPAKTNGPIVVADAPATPVTPLPVKAGDTVVAVATPATPASRVADRESRTLPATPSSTTSSTPGSGHRKEESSDTMRKRKSSFFAKIKGAFHKDKKA